MFWLTLDRVATWYVLRTCGSDLTEVDPDRLDAHEVTDGHRAFPVI